LKGIEVIPNLIKYMMQEMMIVDKSEYVKYVMEKYPMRKWLVLI
jgi:hypothetical protein